MQRPIWILPLLFMLLMAPLWSAPMPIPQMGPPLDKALPAGSRLSAADRELKGLTGERLTPAQILRLQSPAIVMVMSKMRKEGPVRGSGFFVSHEGLVVTSNHLVDGANEIRVKTRTGHIYEDVRVVAQTPESDIAVLQVKGEVPGVLQLANSDDVEVGERIVAIGHPLGLEYTLSSGIVSAVRSAESRGVELIQFSAPVSPGCSGGPIINESGEVVGIVALSHPEGQNLNFAIPSNQVRGALQRVPMADGLPGSVVQSIRLAGVQASQTVQVPGTADAAPDVREPRGPGDAVAPPGAVQTAMAAAPSTAVPAGVDLVPDVPAVQIPPTWRHSVFHLGRRGFRVDSPRAWSVQSQRDETSLTVRVLSPDERIDVRMVTVPVSPRTTLEAFASHVLRAVQAAMAEEGRTATREGEPLDGLRPPRLVRVSAQTVAGKDWKMFVHRHLASDGRDHYSVSMVTLHEAQGYVLRYSVPVEGWDRTREDVRALLATVKIF